MTTTRQTAPWHPLTRIAFRFVFCFFMLYALCCGNATVWEEVPHFGDILEGLFAAPFHDAARWTAVHVLHFHGLAATLHPSGYNDRALDYVAAALMLALALVATGVWSAIDEARESRPVEYHALWLWLRFTLRLALAVAMMIYGCMKLIPIQVAPPSLAVLNEPVGNLSPLTLLWTTVGMNPLYEQITGCVEILCGLLLVYRRTALAGALLSAFVMINVLLFDCFFDVPVKLYATMLLLMSILLAVPDAHALFRFFWQHAPAAPTSDWTPQLRSRNARFFIIGVELLVVFMTVVITPLYDWKRYAPEAASLRHPSPLAGQWHLDAATQPFLTGDGQPLSDIFLEPAGRVTARAADGSLWSGTRYDDATHTLNIYSSLRRRLTYNIIQPDPTHLVLRPTQNAAGFPELHLSRVPLPQQYPLFTRGFHFINEWGFER